MHEVKNRAKSRFKVTVRDVPTFSAHGKISVAAGGERLAVDRTRRDSPRETFESRRPTRLKPRMHGPRKSFRSYRTPHQKESKAPHERGPPFVDFNGRTRQPPVLLERCGKPGGKRGKKEGDLRVAVSPDSQAVSPGDRWRFHNKWQAASLLGIPEKRQAATDRATRPAGNPLRSVNRRVKRHLLYPACLLRPLVHVSPVPFPHGPVFLLVPRGTRNYRCGTWCIYIEPAPERGLAISLSLK